MSEEKPLSENIAFYEAGEYIVSAGIWRTRVNDTLYDTFEIGIRNKITNDFILIQNRFNYQSVQEVANAIAHLLNIKTEHYTPEWCQKWFGDL